MSGSHIHACLAQADHPAPFGAGCSPASWATTMRGATSSTDRRPRVSTRIVITGGSGFLGSLLARRLLREPVGLGGAPPAPVDELTLLDLVAPPADVRADGRMRSVTGELDTALDDVGEVDAVFHLAGVVSGAAQHYRDRHGGSP
jgi:NAD-dependent epimerase/dehydratase family protein